MLPSFDYDRTQIDVRTIGARTENGITKRLIVITTPFGERRVAEIIRPEGAGPFAAILYAHWYEPESPDSNRTQFQYEAGIMVQRGAVCLLIETLWSDRDFFFKRTQADDYENSRRQVIELRQALDILLAEPGIDVGRLAYVGHDFGAMYGVLTGAIDPRPSYYILMACTPRFPEWYLYAPRLEGDARQKFIEAMLPLDPIKNIAKLSPAPVLFQFADNDPHVPPERAREFFDAAREPKEMRWYAAGHGLNEQAEHDRIAWLTEQLHAA